MSNEQEGNPLISSSSVSNETNPKSNSKNTEHSDLETLTIPNEKLNIIDAEMVETLSNSHESSQISNENQFNHSNSKLNANLENLEKNPNKMNDERNIDYHKTIQSKSTVDNINDVHNSGVTYSTAALAPSSLVLQHTTTASTTPNVNSININDNINMSDDAAVAMQCTESLAKSPRANNSRNPVTGTGIFSPIYHPRKMGMQRGT